MPQHELLVLCGGLGRVPDQEMVTVRLNLHGPSRNVRLQIDDISSRLAADIPDALIDLLDIAAYVYAADSAVPRSGPTDTQMGARWRRRFRFVIAVREPGLWSQTEIASALAETLGFLSDDDYQFQFELLHGRPATEAYFPFQGRPEASFRPDEVVLFSGGLDSLAGGGRRAGCPWQARGRGEPSVGHQNRRNAKASRPRTVRAPRTWPDFSCSGLGQSDRRHDS
jgi:hypothetical protein